MSINATRSEGNTDKLNGYLEGLIDGQIGVRVYLS